MHQKIALLEQRVGNLEKNVTFKRLKGRRSRHNAFSRLLTLSLILQVKLAEVGKPKSNWEL